MPALLTRTSSRPSRSSVSATSCSQSPHRPTWQANPTALPPLAGPPPAADRARLASRRGPHLLGRRLARVELAGGDDDVGAGLGQRLHDGAADATRPPRDHGALAGPA